MRELSWIELEDGTEGSREGGREGRDTYEKPWVRSHRNVTEGEIPGPTAVLRPAQEILQGQGGQTCLSQMH